MTRTWYRLWHAWCVRLYFDRLRVMHPERLPTSGPVLYLGTHRNGAVDGFVYRQAVPRGEYLISTQLLRGVLARVFFHGIPVARATDHDDRSHNDEALQHCRDLLGAGGELFIFPEGTSSLGPRHLPFKSGAARLALDCLTRGIAVQIIPLAVHYECAWAFRSRIEIVVGPPVDTHLDPSASPVRQLGELKRRFAASLEAVGANFATPEAQEDAEILATAATLGTHHSYAASLKSFEGGIPEAVGPRWHQLKTRLAARPLWRHQGVPLFPARAPALYGAALAVLAPLALVAAIANLPPLLAAAIAARRCADDRNVIALWRILVGVPLFSAWALTLVGAAWASGHGSWAAGYALVTWAALRTWDRTKKLAVAVGNAVCHPELGPATRDFHRLLLAHLRPLAR